MLLLLPEETLFHICKYLNATDLVALIYCHSRPRGILSESEQLWKYLCKRDYALGSKQLWYGWTYKEFYTKVLHQLRNFLGLWRRKLEYYGGVVEIKVTKNGVCAYECLPPLDEKYKTVDAIADKINIVARAADTNETDKVHKFRHRLIFSFKPVGKEVHCFCYQSMLGHIDQIGHTPLKPSPVESANLNTFICCRGAPKRHLHDDDDDETPRHHPADDSSKNPHTANSIRPAADAIAGDASMAPKSSKQHEEKVENVAALLDNEDYDEDDTVSKNKCIFFLDENLETVCDDDPSLPTTGTKHISRSPFKFVCHCADKHDFNFDYWFEIEHGFKSKHPELITQIVEEFYDEMDYYLRVKKFEALTNSGSCFELYPLMAQTSSNMKSVMPTGHLVIEPGLYFGTYSAHGWEIIDVRYNMNDLALLEGVKISGDVNVFAGKTSFRIFLDKPLYFTKSDQESVDSISEALQRNESAGYKLIKDSSNSQNDEESNLRQFEYFGVPSGCLEKGEVAIYPNRCTFRRLAEGQVAGDHFTNPEFVCCIFSAFDDDSFSLFWPLLDSASFYYRVKTR